MSTDVQSKSKLEIVEIYIFGIDRSGASTNTLEPSPPSANGSSAIAQVALLLLLLLLPTASKIRIRPPVADGATQPDGEYSRIPWALVVFRNMKQRWNVCSCRALPPESTAHIAPGKRRGRVALPVCISNSESCCVPPLVVLSLDHFLSSLLCWLLLSDCTREC